MADSQQLIIGRGAACDVRVTDEYVSPRHCRLSTHGNRWFIEDLGSTNDTRVERRGSTLKAQPLLPGDVILVGHSRLPWSPPAERAPIRVVAEVGTPKGDA